MRIRYTPRARRDLEEIFSYIDERSPAGGRSVKLRIASAIWRLSEHPLIAPETDEPNVHELSIVRYPYKIYYRIDGGELWIVHIRHAARRPWEGTGGAV